MSRQSIPWRSVPLECVAPDGIPLRGRLLYWEKDYTLILDRPFTAQRYGGHLGYARPTAFVYEPGGKAPYREEGSGRICRNLACKDLEKSLLQLYWEHKGNKQMKERIKDVLRSISMVIL